MALVWRDFDIFQLLLEYGADFSKIEGMEDVPEEYKNLINDFKDGSLNFIFNTSIHIPLSSEMRHLSAAGEIFLMI